MIAPSFIFRKQNVEILNEYKKGFSINELFPINSSGIKTHRDHFVIDIDGDNLKERVNCFLNVDLSDEEVRLKYNLKDNRDWSLGDARKSVKYDSHDVLSIDYRPFDIRSIYYDSGLIDFDRVNVMKHMNAGENIGISYNRQIEVNRGFNDIFLHKNLFQLHSLSLKESNSFAPLYVYHDKSDFNSSERDPNLNSEIIKVMAQSMNMVFVTEKDNTDKTFDPIDILDYIYATLHSPSYREKYKEFLKIDFPRIPYPNVKEVFWILVKLGSQLRQIHLLESEVIENYITSYPIDGDNTVTRKIVKKDWELYDTENQLGRIWINDQQYFDQIPLIAWEFYIGGYQPAQKWLKDRKGRTLNFDDILHYQKIIVALSETDRIMQEIDKIDFE